MVIIVIQQFHLLVVIQGRKQFTRKADDKDKDKEKDSDKDKDKDKDKKTDNEKEKDKNDSDSKTEEKKKSGGASDDWENVSAVECYEQFHHCCVVLNIIQYQLQ